MDRKSIISGKDKDLDYQIALLEKILQESPLITKILQKTPELNLPSWYLAAGCIFQTVWNAYYGQSCTYGIKDCDLVYFDPTDLSYEAEDAYIQQGKILFAKSPIEVEIRNEARVHLWYQDHFKEKSIAPYTSTEDAILTFPTTTASIGVTYDKTGKFVVNAPYGLSDLFGMIVRPNKTQITKKMYDNKIKRWRELWPELTIIPWRD